MIISPVALRELCRREFASFGQGELCRFHAHSGIFAQRVPATVSAVTPSVRTDGVYSLREQFAQRVFGLRVAGEKTLNDDGR